MVAVLVVGGLAGWRANRAGTQRRAVAAVRAAGGSIRYDWHNDQAIPFGPAQVMIKPAKPPGPAWLRRWLGDEFFQEVTSVSFKGPVSAGTMAAVGSFDHLEKLFVLNASPTNLNSTIEGGLTALRGATRLKNVLLCSPSTTDADLAILAKNPDLELIRLIGADISDAGLAHLAGLRHLRGFHLADSPKVTDLGIEKMASVLPELEGLELVGTSLSDRSMAPIGKLRNLEWLDLSRTRVTDDGLAHLSGLTSLKKLRLGDTATTDRGLAHFRGLTKLDLLDLKNTAITDAGLAHLAGMTGMIHLNLAGTPITGEGFVHLEKFQKLRLLELQGSKAHDAGMPHLSRLALLDTLDLTGTQVSDRGLDLLRPLTTLTKVSTGSSQVTDAGFEAFRKAMPTVRYGSNQPGPRTPTNP